MSIFLTNASPRATTLLAGIAIILCGAGLFLILRHNFNEPSQAPATITSLSTEQVDSDISQYSERPSAPSAAQAVVEGCGLKFTFVPSIQVVAAGGQIPYTLDVSNSGTLTCVNTSLSIYYSDDESFVSARPAATAKGYYWSIGDLAPGKKYTVSLMTKARSGNDYSQIANSACATADNSKDVCPENLLFVRGTATQNAAASSLSAQPNKELGIWVWESPKQMTAEYEASMIAALEKDHFNAVYVTIDDYLAIADMPSGSAKDAAAAAYMQDLSNLVTRASAAGIAVDVEGGAMDWANEENRSKGYALIDFVDAYNKAHPKAAVRGFQYDVEPYLLPQYENDKANVLLSFIQFIDASAQRMKSVQASFSVVIPHFYDDEVAWTPPITYQGKTQYTYNHLLDVLEQKPGSSLIVMAYRNTFSGDNGTEALSSTEVKEASSGSYSTKVIIAQETGDVEPAYVTFHGLSLADLASSIISINNAYDGDKNFGGVAIHYLEPFLKLQ